MKKLLIISLTLLQSVFLFAQKTDSQLQSQANQIRDETIPKANTANRVGVMFNDVISSKLNLLNNLSDLTNAATARLNLGLGTLATQSIPGSDTQIIQNISGSLSGSSSLTYNPSTNNFNVGNLTQVGSGIRVNNFWMGKDHIDSVGTGSSVGWFFGQGEGHHINVQSSSTLNDSYLYKGFNNSLRVTGSQMYNSGIDGGQGNYIKATGGAFVGSANISSSINSRIVANGGTVKTLGIIGCENCVVSGNHSWAIGGHGLTDDGDTAKVVVPSLKIQYKPVEEDTLTHIMAWNYSTGKVETRLIGSFPQPTIPGAGDGLFFDGTNYTLGDINSDVNVALVGSLNYNGAGGSFIVNGLDSIYLNSTNNILLTPVTGKVILGRPDSGMIQVNGGTVTIQNNSISSGTIITGKRLGKVLSLTLPATNDDPYEDFYIGRTTSTSATPVTIRGTSIPTDNVVYISALIIARRTGGSSGSTGDGAAYKIEGVFKNVSGTVTQIGTTVQTVYGESQAGWDAAFSISGTTVNAQGTGAANNNVTWHASEVKVSGLNQ